MTLISAENLTKHYGIVCAVDQLNLQVEEDSTMCLIGPKGAGKTTITKMILGFVKPDAGRVKVFGEDPWNNVDLRTRIGVVYENPAFPARQKALEYLERVCRIYGQPKSRAGELLAQVNIEDASHKQIRSLSAGTLQKFALAHALINQPKLVVGDEVGANLDSVARGDLFDLVLKLCNEEKIPLLLSSYIFPELDRICNSVALMSRGRILASGKLEGLYEEFPSKTVLISTDQPDKLAELVKSLSYVHQVTTNSKGISVKVIGKTDDTLVADASRFAQKGRIKILNTESTSNSLEDLYRQVCHKKEESQCE